MLQYDIVARKNPHTQKVQYFAQLVPVNPLDLDGVVRQIEKTSTVSSADIKAVLDALQYVVIEAMGQGQSVRLGDLGSFRPTLQGRGADSPETFSEELIKKVMVRFFPSTRMMATKTLGSGQYRLARATGLKSAAGEAGTENP